MEFQMSEEENGINQNKKSEGLVRVKASQEVLKKTRGPNLNWNKKKKEEKDCV